MKRYLSPLGPGALLIGGATSNQQVAPTIIKALGFSPSELQAVRKEQTGPGR